MRKFLSDKEEEKCIIQVNMVVAITVIMATKATEGEVFITIVAAAVLATGYGASLPRRKSPRKWRST